MGSTSQIESSTLERVKNKMTIMNIATAPAVRLSHTLAKGHKILRVVMRGQKSSKCSLR